VSLFLKLAPAPQIAALLDLEPETAFRRKLEYPLEYLRKRRIAYHRIFSQVDTALILDAEQEPELVHRQIVEQAEAKMSLSQKDG
jgi:thymidylate kinase